MPHTVGNTQNCSCLFMMINKDSLSDAACKRTDTIFSNVWEPNFLSKLCNGFSIFVLFVQVRSFSILTNTHFVHVLCYKRGGGRKPAEYLQLRSGEFCIFVSGLAQTCPPLKWSLWNHFRSSTCLNYRILKWFRADDSAKNKICDESRKKCNGVCRGTFPFTTCRSRLTIPAVPTNQNWERVCVFLCQEAVSKATIGVVLSLSSFFQQFNSVLLDNMS